LTACLCFEEFRDELTDGCDRYDPASKALTPDHENFMIEDDMQMMIGDESVDNKPYSQQLMLTTSHRYMIIEDGQKIG
jgi:hypothetical protein